MADEFESEQTATRAEAATILREMADGVTGGALRFGHDDAILVDVADSVTVETELEIEDGEVSVEVELEWLDSTVEDEATAAERTEQSKAPAVEKTNEGETPAVETADERATPAGDETDEDDASAVDEPLETSAETEGSPAETEGSPVGPAELRESLARFEVYLDKGDEWRWRLVHRNGNVIATSGEGYTRKHNAVKGLRSVMSNSADAEVGDESGR